MRIRYPEYYRDFRCLGARCQDNCCIGWEIDIDAKTLMRYQNVSGELGMRLKGAVSQQGTPHFILDENERCPFLNQKNLCDIIIQLGEPGLCAICREHPRFHHTFGSLRESGVGLCCEEAVRLLFAADFPILLCEKEGEEGADEAVDQERLNLLEAVRSTAFSILERPGERISRSMILLLAFAQDVQTLLDEGDVQGVAVLTQGYREQMDELIAESVRLERDSLSAETLFGQIVGVFQELEILNPFWEQKLDQMIDPQYLPLAGSITEKYARHLLFYFLYRYLLTAVDDGDVLSKVKLAVSSVIMLCLAENAAEGEKPMDEKAWRLLVQMYAKEVEYSDQNIPQLTEASWTERCFQLPAYLKLILG